MDQDYPASLNDLNIKRWNLAIEYKIAKFPDEPNSLRPLFLLQAMAGEDIFGRCQRYINKHELVEERKKDPPPADLQKWLPFFHQIVECMTAEVVEHEILIRGGAIGEGNSLKK